ncbi:FecR family protein [Mangrovibacterium marinum]|uniref:FecR family protein n=1 Tax=Mangrovibacterium marinum TaxID=1639118 RepID=A0A2T5BXQ4_9BACT|nr:FecR family protein [Mangrovibacterium marinum]PTN05930.1 FecR family protein [Mangrovibacterium marinum]
MSLEKYHFDIAALVGKSLAGQLNQEEQSVLDGWLAESEENREWYAQISAEPFKLKKLEALKQIDSKSAWAGLKKKQRGKKQRRLMPVWIKYAAAVILPIAIVMGYLFSDNLNVFKRNELPEISPGFSQATLVLDNGKAIRLNDIEENALRVETGAELKLSEKHLAYEQLKTEKAAKPVYNQLIVPRGGEYVLTLSDGTEVSLNADSRLRFPVNFEGNIRKVELEGEAYFKVAHNKAKPFIVNAGGMDVRVLGTEFNISAYKDEPAVYTTLVNGSVSASTADGESTILVPGEQAALEIRSGRLTKQTVDVSFATAWRNGRIRFRDRPLDEIMSNVERWYDVKVIYEDDDLRKMTFGCNLDRYSNIEPLLKVFEANGLLTMSINDRVITVRHASH